MIRGALIFAAGLVIGYSKAMSEVPEAKEFLEALKKEWAQSSVEVDEAVEADEAAEPAKTKAKPKPRTARTRADDIEHVPKGETPQ